MVQINFTKCDGPKCKGQVESSELKTNRYHKLILGGGDFKKSFGAQREFDFCSVKCTLKFLSDLYDQKIQKNEPERDVPSPTGDTDYFINSVDEMAKELRVPKSWLYARTRERGPGAIPRIKIGKYVRFERGKVMEWINKKYNS